MITLEKFIIGLYASVNFDLPKAESLQRHAEGNTFILTTCPSDPKGLVCCQLFQIPKQLTWLLGTRTKVIKSTLNFQVLKWLKMKVLSAKDDWTIEWQWTWNTERFSGRILASRVYSLEAFLILSLESSLPAHNFLPVSPHKSSLVPTFCATFMIDIECLVLDCLKHETRLDRARERNIPKGLRYSGQFLLVLRRWPLTTSVPLKSILNLVTFGQQ